MTNPKLSKVQQERTISEGLAVGFLALGIESVSSNTVTVDLGFRRAWRAWEFAGRFPQVHASGNRDDIRRILHASARRSGLMAAWESGKTFRPYLVIDGWTFEDVAKDLEASTGVPLDGWMALAREFTAPV